MKEYSPSIEKKIAIPLMVVMVECQGGFAYAQTHTSEEYKRQEAFGEAYKLFEKAIDQTSDEELQSIGNGENSLTIRRKIKHVLPAIWTEGYEENVQGIFSTVYARANYDVLNNGAKIFFEKIEPYGESFNDRSDYSQAEHEENCLRILGNITQATSIPASSVQEKKDANCTVQFYPARSIKKDHAGSESPKTSFNGIAGLGGITGRIALPVYSSRDLTEYFQSAIVKTQGLIKFTRSYILSDSAAHEFGHIIGIGHVYEDIPKEDKPDSLDIMSGKGSWYKLYFDYEYKEESKRPGEYFDNEQGKAFEIDSQYKRPEKSDSFLLIRWLRLQAIKGALKGLLEKAEQLAVKHRKKAEE